MTWTEVHSPYSEIEVGKALLWRAVAPYITDPETMTFSPEVIKPVKVEIRGNKGTRTMAEIPTDWPDDRDRYVVEREMVKAATCRKNDHTFDLGMRPIEIEKSPEGDARMVIHSMLDERTAKCHKDGISLLREGKEIFEKRMGGQEAELAKAIEGALTLDKFRMGLNYNHCEHALTPDIKLDDGGYTYGIYKKTLHSQGRERPVINFFTQTTTKPRTVSSYDTFKEETSTSAGFMFPKRREMLPEDLPIKELFPQELLSQAFKQSRDDVGFLNAQAHLLFDRILTTGESSTIAPSLRLLHQIHSDLAGKTKLDYSSAVRTDAGRALANGSQGGHVQQLLGQGNAELATAREEDPAVADFRETLKLRATYTAISTAFEQASDAYAQTRDSELTRVIFEGLLPQTFSKVEALTSGNAGLSTGGR